ncbi:MAG: hypothetical protein R3343_14230 [Nitriliruptorales bacterium]|nr:hypothetical protein [Nitriliruptorales bacterium]
MTTCDVCGLPTSSESPPPLEHRATSNRIVDWHVREIRAVHALPVGRSGRWSCSRCGDEFKVSDSWAVDHQIAPESAVRTFVVCPACAGEVRPARLIVDAERLSRERAPRPLRELVDQVRELRGVDERVVRLRATDAEELAAQCRVPLRQLTDRLRTRGLARLS